MTTQTDLEKARERVRVFEQCESSAGALNKILKQYPKGSTDAEALKRAKNALFFVTVRRLDEFIEFCAEMESQDSN